MLLAQQGEEVQERRARSQGAFDKEGERVFKRA